MIPYSLSKADVQLSLVIHAALSMEVGISVSILVTVF